MPSTLGAVPEPSTLDSSTQVSSTQVSSTQVQTAGAATRTAALASQLADLAAAVEDEVPAAALPALLQQVRHLSEALRRREAVHVREALRAPSFAFREAQAALAALRGEFADLCRQVVRSGGAGLTGRARRELLDLAYLIKCAPLTDEEDLRALRRARQSRAS